MRRQVGLAAVLASLVVGAPGVAYADGANGPIVFTRVEHPKAHEYGFDEAWTVDPDGSGEQLLFGSGVEDNSYPAWSPDGRSLAFWRNNSLVVAGADGSGSRELARGTGYDVSWSPDGTRLVYPVYTGNGLESEVRVMNADGTDAHVIHTGSHVQETVWSPRGDRIAFVEDDKGAYLSPPRVLPDPVVFTMDVDGGDVRQVSDNVGGMDRSTYQDVSPAWSPDGTRIAYASDRDRTEVYCPSCEETAWDIYVVNADDGSGLVRLHQDGSEHEPAWSPDGTSLAYLWGPGLRAIHDVDVRDLATGAVTTVAHNAYDGLDWGRVRGSMPQADLSVGLSADAASVSPGNAVTLTATVHNDGRVVAGSAAVEIRPPAGSAFDGAGSPGCAPASGGALRCAAGDLAPGAAATFTVRTTAGDASVGEASALATSATTDPDTTDNRATVPIAVCTRLGTSGRDRLRGTAGADVLCGGGGDDVLFGRGGADVLVGGPGRDRLRGGAGKDTASYAQSRHKVTVDLAGRTGDGDGSDRLTRVESVVGSRYADRLSGSRGANVLVGGAGDDRLVPGGGRDRVDGGLGDDRLDYSDAPRGVHVDLSKRRASGDGDDRWVAVEGAVGSRYADLITGTVAGNVVTGGDGADRIEALGGDARVTGGAGADRLDGGDGNDRLVGGAGRDRCDQDLGRGRTSQCERT